MCGIIGYIGTRQAGPILYKGLRQLEYRGYDSAGAATLDNGVHLRKDIGKIDEIEQKCCLSSLPGTIGIGHTRWATHGGVTKANAHPHVSCTGDIIVVHNGIIENFQELHGQLHEHTFVSQTDTEILPHLIEAQHLPLLEAVPAALKHVKGSYAMLVLSAKEPDTIIAVRNESPLIIGLAGHGLFAASDVLPFLDQTRTVVYLNDHEMAVLTRKGASFYNMRTMNEIKKDVDTITWSAVATDKGQCEHYMLKEILEQPNALRNALVQDKKKLEAFSQTIRRAQSLKIVACGTSRHAALLGRYLFTQLAKKGADVYIASEFTYFADAVDNEAVILAISQSGETADVLDGLRKAKRKGARILSMINVIGSTIDRLSDLSLSINCGPEVGVASTKAFLNQLAIFYLVAHAMAGLYDKGAADLRQVSHLVQDTITQSREPIKQLAQMIAGRNHVYYLGRGVNFPIATEGALKLKEISYIHAEGMPAGELKHGTLALIEQGTPVILINPSDYTHSDSLSNGMETKARGAFLIGLSNRSNDAYDYHIQLPTPDNVLLYPFLAAVPLQLLAYETAVAKGLDPDKPRHLAKSVTVR